MHSAQPKRITAIWTRDVNSDRLAGRLRTIVSIRGAMQAQFSVRDLRLRNLLEQPSLRFVGSAMLAALRSLLSGSLPALQCLLYSDTRNHRGLLRDIESDPPSTVYADGVRSYYLLQRLQKSRGRIRIVVDFDDLISRRMEMLGTTGTSLSLGYLNDKIPGRLRSALALGAISRLLARYECAAVRQAEDRIGRWADVVTLVSSIEAETLRSRYQRLGCKAKVSVIPPPVDIVRPPRRYDSFSRFIFIGPDSLPQNKLTIQWIHDLWESIRPAAEIHIFGHMASEWRPVPGVVFRNYAASLDDVYVEGAVLLAPGVLRGGVKTKVAEAFAFGCAAVGNNITFEGLSLEDYPLRFDNKEELIGFIEAPGPHLEKMRIAAASGQNYAKAHLSRETFQRRWSEALG